MVPAARVDHDLGGTSVRRQVRFHVARNSLWTAVRCIPEGSRKLVLRRIADELRWAPRRMLPTELHGRAAAVAGLRWALRERRAIQAARRLEPAEVRERLRDPEPWRVAA